MRSRTSVALMAMSLALCGFAGLPSQSSAAVQLIGGTAERTIPLAVVEQKNTPPVLAGDLRLTLQSTSAKEQRLYVLLASPDLGKTDVLVRTKLRPHSLTDVTATVKLPHGQEPSALDGTVLIDTIPAGSSHVTRLSLPVQATIEPIGDVRFAPATAVVQATRWCLGVFNCNTRNGGSIQLSGAGVGALLAELSAAGVKELTSSLRSGSNTLGVHLTDLKANPNQPGVASAKLSLDSKPPPGAFSGSVALSPLLPHAPVLDVEVHSRYMFAWAALAILLGVLLAGYLYQQLGLSRRKRMLREMMEQTINVEYCPRRHMNVVDGVRGRETLIWDAAIACPLKDDPNWTYTTELDRSSDIYTAIHWARNDADLDEAQAAAVKVLKEVKTWLLTITDVRALWELARTQRTRMKQWEKTTTAVDGELLLLKAKHVPADAASCETLLAKVRQQLEWQRCFGQAWDLQSQLLKMDEQVQSAASDVNLEALDKEAKPVQERSLDEQDDLMRKLDADYGQLLEIAADADLQILTPKHTGEEARQLTSLRLRSEISSLDHPGPLTAALISAGRVIGPSTSSADLALSHRLEKQDETASAQQPAALDRGSRPKAPPTSNRFTAVTRRLRLLDGALSMAIVVAISLLYAAQVYGPDWGSVADWGTAFGAGFGGQVGVKWALLPIYHSLRLRPSTTGQSGAEAATKSSG